MDQGAGAGDLLFLRLFWKEADNPWHGAAEQVNQLCAFLQRDDQDDRVSICLLEYYNGPVEAFRQLRRQIWPDVEFHDRLFSKTRHQLALALLCNLGQSINHNTPHLVRDVLSQDACLHCEPEDDIHCPACNDGDSNLLHTIASNVGYRASLGETLLDDWHDLVRDALANKSSVHQIQDLKTPFLVLVTAALLQPLCEPDSFKRTLNDRFARCNLIMGIWLKDVKHGGIDLEEYGRKEQKLINSGRIDKDVDYSWYDRRYGDDNWRSIRLVALEYGPLVGDWKLWWSEPTDKLAGDFWQLVEHQPAVMPGSWVEEDV